MINTIKETLPIVDAIKKYLPELTIVRRGNRLWASCPIHNDKTPSLLINEDKNTAHCFGCQWHGDTIDLLSKVWGTSFTETINILIADLGISQNNDNRRFTPPSRKQPIIPDRVLPLKLMELNHSLKTRLKRATIDDLETDYFAQIIDSLSKIEILLDKIDHEEKDISLALAEQARSFISNAA